MRTLRRQSMETARTDFDQRLLHHVAVTSLRQNDPSLVRMLSSFGFEGTRGSAIVFPHLFHSLLKRLGPKSEPQLFRDSTSIRTPTPELFLAHTSSRVNVHTSRPKSDPYGIVTNWMS